MAGEPEAVKKSRKEPNKIVTAYLILYNAVQVVGWSALLLQILVYYATPSKTGTLWDAVKLTVIIFQNAALLEILHVALGFVKSSFILTVAQVYSRVMVVGGVLLVTPTAPLSIGLPLALLAWSITEIIRYSYYALNLISHVPHFLVWCRYTFFIVLYPIGVTGELLCMWAAQQYIAETGKWSFELPNPWNFTFSYSYFIILNMLAYIPGFPQLYFHMFAQRKKVLGGNVSPQIKKSK